ncbi:hypothetical protein [Rhizobium sp. 2MFCol3.1]|uniref:hypothetical protein n=1 Tax=Rhizobium sp. 2MFCol3.1 TaxID=1246459 RepID=UPI000371A1F4|nr:hypothetical protein [Rhizobium sp. 2MFCol3.1]
MPGELTMRVVREDYARRVSVYSRSDGKYEYVEEVLSEWDDSPPSWVAERTSGILASAKNAMAEARQMIEWMRLPSATNSRPTDVDLPLRRWRPVGVAERALIIHLLGQEFPGRAEILEQLNSLEVMRIGFGSSLKLRSDGPYAEVKDSDAPSSRPNDRIPVEGFYDDVIDETKGMLGIAALVRLALHVTGGELSELEIYKENGKPILIDPYEIDLSRVHFY